ncbi:MAG: secondary thiamine-phosphate synthase enzyme YjbQ [Myxococcaceae bacterium]|jgi:secondary thiamine-phosphate synthase enzyme|nr:secondary thiamine-phosphate synthase enzyme YjbQ [Myxococcaceae bacterium]
MWTQHLGELTVATSGRGFTDVTGELAHWLSERGARDGLVTLFIRHTSASLVVHENADPEVRADLERFFSRLVADGDPLFRHDAEGPDDMPAHVRAVLTQTQVAIPVRGGRLDLGTWQGVSVWEHRTHPHRRTVSLHFAGT